MKRVCTNCEHVSLDGNLWCQEPDCPANRIPTTLNYGDYLGDIKILRLLRIFRSSAIYEAQRGEKQLLLKVAHPGFEEFLVNEAATYMQLLPTHEIGIPHLEAPYWRGTISYSPYGIVSFRGETKYYMVFRYLKGEFLRDRLLNNPEPWFQHTGWIAIRISRIVDTLHRKGLLHLNITPDVIMLHETADRYENGVRVFQPVLVDLGMLKAPGIITIEDVETFKKYIPANYLAPELTVPGSEIGFKTDTYALGSLVHEMLTGIQRPKYSTIVTSRDAPDKSPLIQRPDLPRAELIIDTIHKSLSKSLDDRPSIDEFYSRLAPVVGPEPAKQDWRKGLGQLSRISLILYLLAIIGLIVFVMLMLLIAFTSPPSQPIQ